MRSGSCSHQEYRVQRGREIETLCSTGPQAKEQQSAERAAVGSSGSDNRSIQLFKGSHASDIIAPTIVRPGHSSTRYLSDELYHRIPPRQYYARTKTDEHQPRIIPAPTLVAAGPLAMDQQRIKGSEVKIRNGLVHMLRLATPLSRDSCSMIPINKR